MIEIKKYDLPDFDIMHDQETPSGHFLWVPDDVYVVLGNSNKPHENLNEDKITEDGVQVYKRPSGGETVVLTPNTLVISIKIMQDKFADPQRYFRYFNQKIIQGLENAGVQNVNYRGISDVAINSRKILGSSIYRKRKAVFYHAVLNISEPVETIERYIKHPTKEPDYRKGRSHKEFVTSLHNEGYPFSVEQLRDALKVALSEINEDEVAEIRS